MRLLRPLLLSLLTLLAAPALKAQSLSEMAGQMVMVGFQGNAATAPGVVAVREEISRGVVGGVMYLGFNVASLDAVRRMNAEFAGARPQLPPFIALDQEGGQVRRLRPDIGFPATPSAQSLAGRGREAARASYAEMAEGLARAGFSLNLAPVVDLDLNPANPVIGRHQRAYGADPAAVAGMAEAFVDAHRAAGVLTALKHYPGHGSSAGDTHQGFVDVSGQWREVELEPYRLLFAADRADMVMVAHIHNSRSNEHDGAALPASLSPYWIDHVLRGQLGFDGVVISDDMQMSAVATHFGLTATVRRAVMAGNDILLFSNTADYDPAFGARLHAILLAEAEADPAFAARIAESYRRILALKHRLAAL